MLNRSMFSSDSEEWATPDAFFAEVDAEFGFTLDVAASSSNTKYPPRFFTKEADGLSQDWGHNVCWMNPPYGKEIGRWVRKAYEESLRGATVVALLPSRTDTRWFHDWVYGKAEIRFVKGRLVFKGASSGAPFPSLLAIYYPKKES